MFRRLCKAAYLFFMMSMLCGCIFAESSDDKIAEWPYDVVQSETLPEEILKIIESKKEQPFQMAYHEDDVSYIILGYGKQDTSGYSIEVHDVYQGEDSLWVDTELIGPRKDEPVEEIPSFPYVVIKVQKVEQLIRFKS